MPIHSTKSAYMQTTCYCTYRTFVHHDKKSSALLTNSHGFHIIEPISKDKSIALGLSLKTAGTLQDPTLPLSTGNIKHLEIPVSSRLSIQAQLYTPGK